MSRKNLVCLQVFAVLATLGPAFFQASSAYGQAVNATLAGKVVDSSGGSIGKASVTATNTAGAAVTIAGAAYGRIALAP